MAERMNRPRAVPFVSYAITTFFAGDQKTEGREVRALIIHNQMSGFGSDAIYEFQRALLHAGDEATFRVPSRDFLPEDVVSDVDNYDLVVLSGGDGTMASLLYALRNRSIPTCIFPSGTSNLTFINLGNAPEPASIARACRKCRTIQTDLGEMSWIAPDGTKRTKGFCMMSGTGYDADLMRTAAINKQSLGEAAYFAAALSNLNPTVTHFTITVDGIVHERVGIACIVANNAMIQNEIEIIPNNSMTDGLLDLIVLEVSQPVELLQTGAAVLFDKAGTKRARPHIESFRGRSIDVVSSDPIPLQIDGDPMEDAVTAYHAEVLPGVNRIIVDGLSRYRGEATEPDQSFPDASVMPFPAL